MGPPVPLARGLRSSRGRRRSPLPLIPWRHHSSRSGEAQAGSGGCGGRHSKQGTSTRTPSPSRGTRPLPKDAETGPPFKVLHTVHRGQLRGRGWLSSKRCQNNTSYCSDDPQSWEGGGLRQLSLLTYAHPAFSGALGPASRCYDRVATPPPSHIFTGPGPDRTRCGPGWRR